IAERDMRASLTIGLPETAGLADIFRRKKLAGGPGFEPRLTESESAVLPLNYPPKGAERHGPRGVDSEAVRRRQGPGANRVWRKRGVLEVGAGDASCLRRAID